MKYNVNARTIESTDKCRHDFSCLDGNLECLCNVNKSISDKLILVDPNRSAICHYLLSFGNSFICNCPVRTEIHMMYNA